MILLPPVRGENIAFKRSASPLTTGTLWTYTGGIRVHAINGVVRTIIQNQTTNLKLSIKNDSLTAIDLCTNVDIDTDAVGTLYSLPAAVGSAMVATTLGAALALLVAPFEAIPSTSGIITVTYGAASTGVVDWYLRWSPITPGATVA